MKWCTCLLSAVFMVAVAGLGVHSSLEQRKIFRTIHGAGAQVALPFMLKASNQPPVVLMGSGLETPPSGALQLCNTQHTGVRS